MLFKGFGIQKVPYRKFCCELKYRPPGDDGTSEVLIEEAIIEVPCLRNSDMEKQWCFVIAWNKLYSPEWSDKGVNQCFIFTSNYGELLARLEKQEFIDEPMQKFPVPTKGQWSNWRGEVQKQFRRIYGCHLNW